MHPILISLGNFTISSFGFFLSVAFLAGLFVIWRLSRVYDIDEEKTLDISLLTFFGGLIGARILFILENLSIFDSLSKMILINRFPGLSFWGGIIGGGSVLYFLSRRFRIPSLQMADFISVGVLVGLIFGSFGCLLGSCHPGLPSNLFLAIPQVGLIGSRFPLQVLEVLVYLYLFLNLWKICLRFHWSGKVVSETLIYLGLILFLSEFLRGDRLSYFLGISFNRIFSTLAILSGTYLFYSKSGRSVGMDLRLLIRVLSNPSERKRWVETLKKSWYNLRVNWRSNTIRIYKIGSLRFKRILRSSNVKLKPPEF